MRSSFTFTYNYGHVTCHEVKMKEIGGELLSTFGMNALEDLN